MAKLKVVVGVLVVMLAACTTEIRATSLTNPPPKEPLKNFGQFVLKPVELNETDAKDSDNRRAAKKIDEHLNQYLNPLLVSWSTIGGRVLEITPKIEHLKFVSGGTRFMAGYMAGSSAVVMRVEFLDHETGSIVANPEFYQHASAMAGGSSVGRSDNAMLARISTLVKLYCLNNYAEAVGGPTGAPPDRVAGG